MILGEIQGQGRIVMFAEGKECEGGGPKVQHPPSLSSSS